MPVLEVASHHHALVGERVMGIGWIVCAKAGLSAKRLSAVSTYLPREERGGERQSEGGRDETTTMGIQINALDQMEYGNGIGMETGLFGDGSMGRQPTFVPASEALGMPLWSSSLCTWMCRPDRITSLTADA